MEDVRVMQTIDPAKRRYWQKRIYDKVDSIAKQLMMDLKSVCQTCDHAGLPGAVVVSDEILAKFDGFSKVINGTWQPEPAKKAKKAKVNDELPEPIKKIAEEVAKNESNGNHW